VMNSRRFMSDMGFSPTARRRATGLLEGDGCVAVAQVL